MPWKVYQLHHCSFCTCFWKSWAWKESTAPLFSVPRCEGSTHEPTLIEAAHRRRGTPDSRTHSRDRTCEHMSTALNVHTRGTWWIFTIPSLPWTTVWYLETTKVILSLPGGSGGKEFACNAGEEGGEDPLEKGMSTPVFLPGGSHGWRSLAGYRLCPKSQTQSSNSHFTFKVILGQMFSRK